MRLGRLAFVAFVALSGSALADTGDTLLVTGQGVNVRTQPSLEGRIVLRVDRNRKVIEIERTGDWVRVEIEGRGGREGWIHGSLLAPVPGGPLEPSAAPAQTPTTAEAVPATAPGGAAADPASAELRQDDPGTALPAAALAATGTDRSVDRFRANVEYLNGRARLVAGVALFTDVEPAGAGIVQVGTTEAWTTVPPAGQRSYLNTLFDRWVAAHDGLEDVSVQIIDDQGTVVMERAGP